MAHIAMVSIPAHGHVNPSLDIVRTLVARGHRVSYANDPSFAAVIAGTGAELKPYRSTLPSTEQEWTGDPIEQLTLFLDDAIAMLPQLHDAYTGDRPDLFLYDIAGAPARLLGERWGIPAIQLSSTFVAWDGYETEMAPAIEAMRADPRGAEYYRRFTDWLAANGSSVTDSIAFQGRPEHCLALIPRALQPHADRVDPAVYRFVGPALGDRCAQGSWTRPATADKVLLVSLGSAFTRHPDFYRRCISAFGALPGWHTVLQIGRHVDPAQLGAVPDSVEVHPWVPQLAILEQADAFLTHAGMGGSSEGLYCGTPMIAAPQAADQFANADQLAALGVARVVDSATVTAQQLRESLLQLTCDATVAARCAAIRQEVREQGGAARAADLVEAGLPAAARAGR
ncbi:macrolide family glycosyltransferase [Actinoplanes teichomyceticus]|uniref:MGT family glycosyltransferase n=1 Tax=Actinoplanes teichomyceticus TaxID=1867 RepID=A0A561VMN8_ACTTI|nr:macrolide family glycosyltransferase [Actinoplanes teichomyceticus]TWG12862.1 MGT family glycosyltransferase [Actinoplanes teichomyceticus]GIF13609.1 macrolide-inactivating glycosyltransferase [Actinoplanes teichomyceticus]